MNNVDLGSTKLDRQIAADFSSARGGAVLNYVIAFLLGKNNDLLSFDEVQRCLRVREQVYVGIRPVEAAKIVGSVNRHQDFDRTFLPRHPRYADRWKRVDRAHYEFTKMPPPILLKVGDIYFVYDGHNRISVARKHGIERIDADIVEYKTRLPVKENLRPEDLAIMGEYTDFLEKTNLDHLRPDQHIEFSLPGQYRILVQHIETHRYFLGQERQQHVSWEEAVTNWYDSFYMPLVRIIRERNVLAHFPGRTEADLYLWIMDHLHYLKERHGPALRPEMAADDFIRRFSRTPAKALKRSVERAIAGMSWAMGHITAIHRSTVLPQLGGGHPR